MTRGSPWWKKMYHHFQADWESGDENNNRRSNVESIFAAVKKMLGETLKSKNRTTQVYELLCKTEAYNVTELAVREIGSGEDGIPERITGEGPPNGMVPRDKDTKITTITRNSTRPTLAILRCTGGMNLVKTQRL